MNKRIVFFDGVCNLCNSAVDLIVKNDQKRKLAIASLQGETAKKYLPEDQRVALDSIILWEEGSLFEKSTAALKIARYLSFPWNLLYSLIILPRFVRDPIYDLIARNRYNMFGRQETCRLPTPEEKSHFLP